MRLALLFLCIGATQAATQSVYITNVNYVDVANSRIVPNYNYGNPAGRRIDGRGKYLMPSLYDMHTHLMSGRLSADRALKLSLVNGVTGLRDMGGYLDSMVVLRERLASDSTLPRVWFAGTLIDGPKHRWSHAFALHITNPDEARSVVDSLRVLKVDFLKIYGGIPAEAYFALTQRAKEVGLTFGGHIPMSVSTSAAAKAGQRTFEHATLDMFSECVPDGPARVRTILNAWTMGGYPARVAEMKKFREARDEAACAKMMSNLAAANAYVVPTVVNEIKQDRNLANALSYLSKDLQDACSSTLEMMAPAREGSLAVHESFQQDVKALHSAGVKLMAGTDFPNACIVPGFSLHAELRYFVALGLTPAEALRTATITPREFFNVKDTDVIMLDANPLDDIRNTTRIAGIHIRGRWLDQNELQRMLTSLKAN